MSWNSDWLVLPRVLNTIMAIGRPGSMYEMRYSVNTFKPMDMFVMAYIMPIGIFAYD